MTGRRWRRGIGAVVVAVLAGMPVAACAKEISGAATAAPGATGGSRPSTSNSAEPAADGGAKDLLGSLTTLEPCSLSDPGEFAKFGTAKLGVPDSLDDCLIEIKASAPEPILVYVGSLDTVEAVPDVNGKKATELSGGLKVVDYDTESTYCSQLLVFTDGITLSVNASLFDGAEPKLCDIVRAGMDKVVEVVQAGEVKHRRYPGNSLGSLNACEVLPDSALAAVPELANVKSRAYPAQHSCSWTAADNNTRVRVMFTAGPPPKAAGEGVSDAPIAGRASVLTPTPNAGTYVFCGAQTAHVPFSAPGQEGLVEIAGVFVRKQKGQLDAACKAATEVANAVWPKLPKP